MVGLKLAVMRDESVHCLGHCRVGEEEAATTAEASTITCRKNEEAHSSYEEIYTTIAIGIIATLT